MTGRQFLKWNKLKEVFTDYHLEKSSRNYLINVIKEYQFTNGIKISNNPIINCKGKEWKK